MTAKAVHVRRPICGVLLLDKPTGITSQTAVSRVRHLLDAEKAGHTGTLDPMASGLLPVCLGEATKFSGLLLNSDKTYDAVIRLGVTTTTGDMEGDVTARQSVSVGPAAARAALVGFIGEIEQTPPMYSAIKHGGKPLYKYARAGVEVVRVPRRVRIYEIDLERFEGDELHIRVRCGKGTYIRALAEQIGSALGCGACLAALVRTAVGGFRLDEAASLERLQAMTAEVRLSQLLPVDALAAGLPRLDLDAAQSRRIATGGRITDVPGPQAGLVRLYGPHRQYLGVGTVEAPGVLVPHRMMSDRVPG